jgi:hypothetical protein
VTEPSDSEHNTAPPRLAPVQPRDRSFTDRDVILKQLRADFNDGAEKQVLTGLGGVGKSQLAVEYAHRYKSAYNFVWWIDAGERSVIAAQFVALGHELGCHPSDLGNTDGARAAVLDKILDLQRWLLIFDNAENPDRIVKWLPSGGGHVLITSRSSVWNEIADRIEVDVLPRPESVALLRKWTRVPGDGDADLLAGELGDLPLALAQAGKFMAKTGGMPATEYLGLLNDVAAEVLKEGRPLSYPRSLAAATDLSFKRLAAEDPQAAQVAILCAFLAPDPIPAGLFSGAANALPADLAARVGSPLTWRKILARLHQLARVEKNTIQMHRLTQAILRARLNPGEAAEARARIGALLVARHPGDPAQPAQWPDWAEIMPHLLAIEEAVAVTDSTELRQLACQGCAYLLALGDKENRERSAGLADRLRGRWRHLLGDDDPDILLITQQLARAQRAMGHDADARELDEDTWTRCRRLFGDDDRRTLLSASNLAIDLIRLGDGEQAKKLNEETYERRRRAFGDDDPDTLTSAGNLASDLAELDHLQRARELYEDTLERRRRVLGEDHLDTLNDEMNLAITIAQQGDAVSARPRAADAVARLCAIQGKYHPRTLTTINNFARMLSEIAGELPAAKQRATEAVEGLRRVLGPDHHFTRAAEETLAGIVRRLADEDER